MWVRNWRCYAYVTIRHGQRQKDEWPTSATTVKARAAFSSLVFGTRIQFAPKTRERSGSVGRSWIYRPPNIPSFYSVRRQKFQCKSRAERNGQHQFRMDRQHRGERFVDHSILKRERLAQENQRKVSGKNHGIGEKARSCENFQPFDDSGIDPER